MKIARHRGLKVPIPKRSASPRATSTRRWWDSLKALDPQRPIREADMAISTRMTSRAEEFHPRALPEPYVNLSIHTAPDVRPLEQVERLCLVHGLLPAPPVGPWPRLNNAAPSLQPHYRTFLARKKLTCSDHATNSSCRRCHKDGSGGERLDLHGVAKVGQPFDQAFFLLVGGAAIEVIATEVLIRRPVL